MKYIFPFILLLILNSCNENKSVSLEDSVKDPLLLVLNSNEIRLSKDENNYSLLVLNSLIKTDIGRKMAAATSSMILYEFIVSENNMLNYNTKIYILYDNNDRYIYSLKEVGSVLKAKETIDYLFSGSLNRQKDTIFKFSCSSDEASAFKNSLDLTNEANIVGWELNKDLTCNGSTSIIDFYLFLNPSNIKVVISVNVLTNKVIDIHSF